MANVFPVQTSDRRKVSQKRRTALIGQGQRMSNWMYNMKQSERLPDDIRQELRLMQEDWDAIKNGG